MNRPLNFLPIHDYQTVPPIPIADDYLTAETVHPILIANGYLSAEVVPD
jgi:hypothetical protein